MKNKLDEINIRYILLTLIDSGWTRQQALGLIKNIPLRKLYPDFRTNYFLDKIHSRELVKVGISMPQASAYMNTFISKYHWEDLGVSIPTYLKLPFLEDLYLELNE